MNWSAHWLLRRPWFLGVSVAGVVADLCTKSMAFAHHRAVQGVYGAKQPVLWIEDATLQVGIVREHNTGMAFGLMQGSSVGLVALIAVRVGVAALLLFLVRRVPESSRSQQLALGALLAGALGNLLDNLVTFEAEHPHAVRDFIHVRCGGWAFPTFNVADALVTVGAIWFLWLARPRRDGSADRDESSDAASASGSDRGRVDA